MWDDPIVAEVRSTRERLAEQFAFDVHAIFADLRARQATLGARLVQRPRTLEVEPGAESDRDSTALHPGR